MIESMVYCSPRSTSAGIPMSMTQMEFGRRMLAGRLSEVAGEATLDTDIRMRTLRLRRTADRWWESTGSEAREWLTAYAAGVNAFIEAPGGPCPQIARGRITTP